MTTLIDRRLNPRDKTIKNRQKFIERSKHQIKKVVKEAIDHGNIVDLEKGKIKIKVKNSSEPSFNIDPRTGNRKRILPGNRKYVVGDKEEKPDSQSGSSGNKASNSGESEDEFEFVLSENEYLNFIFEDLELPDLVKKQMKDFLKTTTKRSGFKNQGNPSQLDVVRSLKNSYGRRIGLHRPKNEEIELLEKQIEENKNKGLEFVSLLEQLNELKKKQKRIPWLDPFDMRYRNFDQVPQPMSKAVMFCIMDVSASMGQNEKDIAKRFFFLLHMFLRRKYDKVDIVFIKHHSEAVECSEWEFFYGKTTGGTVVSTSLELMNKIIQERYPLNEWNIYGAQASDGDNISDDNENCLRLMKELLIKIQYYAYVEIKLNQNADFFTGSSDLWKTYSSISDKKLNMKKVYKIQDIWTVFKELFSKEIK